MYPICLRLIQKCVVDFLIVLIERFSLQRILSRTHGLLVTAKSLTLVHQKVHSRLPISVN